ncbi:MAG: hypothetical protein H8E55_71615 [Pelagibacterales bacterium]|nr:hypothetical protein [Pelagibacterales bacterium]
MTYKEQSDWNDKNEIKCLLILRKLEKEGFPRGRQTELSQEMEEETNLKRSSISAKVSNFKSVTGVNEDSNASENTKRIYKKYKNYSIDQLKEEIRKK